MIEIWTGKTGTGKSANLANKILNLLARNLRWLKITKKQRPVISNIRLSEKLEKQFNKENQTLIKYWTNVEELTTLRDCDIIWDEIATNLDSTQWQNTPLDVKRFLAQHRKRGIDIYGTSQRFNAVEVNMRALVDHLWVCRKLFGTRNPSATRPKIKRPWAFVWNWEVDPLKFDDLKQEHIGWDFLWVDKDIIEAYDTNQEIEMGIFPPLHHIERICANPTCKFHRVVHY